MSDIPMRYDARIDEMVPVDQAWVDLAQQRLKEQFDALKIARTAQDHGRDCSRLAAAERQQSRQDSEESGKGVQQGRSAEEAREVACAYAVTVDGFIEIKLRAIRNPSSPYLVWMRRSTWEKLATHSYEGLFFIPCPPNASEPQDFRVLVDMIELGSPR